MRKYQNVFLAAGILLIGIAVIIFGLRSFHNKSSNDHEMNVSETVATVSEATNEPLNGRESIFVEALGRNCQWIPEYESYYDEETGCYFWYNDTIPNPAWQYWYSRISSNYKNYGWMEWNPEKQQWYIETRAGEWRKLPAKYVSDDLWHMEKSQ